MSGVSDFVAGVPGFYRRSGVEQLLVLAWYLEARAGKAAFDGADIRRCFREAGLEALDTSVYFPRLASKRPPQLIKERAGFRLASSLRREMDLKLGGDPVAAAITRTLTELPGKLPDLLERTYLDEALSCYKVKAYRAAVIMAWNLAYDHLARWILSDPTRLAGMNAGISSRYPKKNLKIVHSDDFSELKESEAIEAMRCGGLIDKNALQLLTEKLRRRNMAAHPSRVKVTQHQADDMISDLVENVILVYR